MAVALGASVALLLAGCAQKLPEKKRDGRLRVVATTSIVADMVHQIAGDRIELHALMGAGVDPHLYKASEGDVLRIAQADVVFYNGLHLEAKMADVLEKISKRVRTVAVTARIPRERLLRTEANHETPDPHVWFDVGLWRLTVPEIRDALSELDPASSDTFHRNAAAFDRELQELDAYIRTRAATIPARQRVLITAHDAFRYFGRAYGFEVVGLQGISTASEAGTNDIERLARLITERHVRAIFVESSVPQRTVRAVQQAVRARGGDVAIGGELFSDALGNPGTPEGTYVGMVRYNIETIVKALKP
ncbi:MAG: metal ABC transporter solute-binding protein, Zn/Mn family [Candidatus Sumerlaeaceae bacterium]